MKIYYDKNDRLLKEEDNVMITFPSKIYTCSEEEAIMYKDCPNLIPKDILIDFDNRHENGEYLILDKKTSLPLITEERKMKSKLFIMKLPYDIPEYDLKKDEEEMMLAFEGGCIGLFRFNKDRIEFIK